MYPILVEWVGNSIFIAMPCGALIWTLLYVCFQRIHSSITPKISEHLCALLAAIVGSMWPIYQLEWPIDFAQGDKTNTEWQQNLFVFWGSFYLYDINHYLYAAKTSSNVTMIVHHMMDILGTMLCHYFRTVGYITAVGLVIIEVPDILTEIRLLMKEADLKGTRMYRQYFCVELVVRIFSRGVLFPYITYGFLFVAASNIIIKTVLIAQFVLNVQICRVIIFALHQNWTKMVADTGKGEKK